ncbi:MAG: DUF3151 family protein [Acidimicrobiales bacterium]
MANDPHVSLSTGLPETILPALDPAVAATLSSAMALPAESRRPALAAIAAAHPTCLAAWAALSDVAGDDVEAYAYARVGYHRGLDALRAAGWRGSGYVRWRYPSNRGVLASLEALRRSAGAIGEGMEE